MLSTKRDYQRNFKSNENKMIHPGNRIADFLLSSMCLPSRKLYFITYGLLYEDTLKIKLTSSSTSSVLAVEKVYEVLGEDIISPNTLSEVSVPFIGVKNVNVQFDQRLLTISGFMLSLNRWK